MTEKTAAKVVNAIGIRYAGLIMMPRKMMAVKPPAWFAPVLITLSVAWSPPLL